MHRRVGATSGSTAATALSFDAALREFAAAEAALAYARHHAAAAQAAEHGEARAAADALRCLLTPATRQEGSPGGPPALQPHTAMTPTSLTP